LFDEIDTGAILQLTILGNGQTKVKVSPRYARPDQHNGCRLHSEKIGGNGEGKRRFRFSTHGPVTNLGAGACCQPQLLQAFRWQTRRQERLGRSQVAVLTPDGVGCQRRWFIDGRIDEHIAGQHGSPFQRFHS
jgi:hypothetical protein